jgi:hypothetical protein
MPLFEISLISGMSVWRSLSFNFCSFFFSEGYRRFPVRLSHLRLVLREERRKHCIGLDGWRMEERNGEEGNCVLKSPLVVGSNG